MDAKLPSDKIEIKSMHEAKINNLWLLMRIHSGFPVRSHFNQYYCLNIDWKEQNDI
jgi:hypothetical protein